MNYGKTIPCTFFFYKIDAISLAPLLSSPLTLMSSIYFVKASIADIYSYKNIFDFVWENTLTSKINQNIYTQALSANKEGNFICFPERSSRKTLGPAKKLQSGTVALSPTFHSLNYKQIKLTKLII